MKYEKHTVPFDESYLIAAGTDPGNVIYFDIETTGLNADRSHIYLIGWAVRSADFALNGCWDTEQYLAESAAEERELLKLFSDTLRQYSVIVQFNGDLFDIPFVRKRCGVHSLEDPFSESTAIDLYKKLRPFKSLLGLTKLKQKSVEEFLNIQRRDPYNGGQLIDVYRLYRENASIKDDMSPELLRTQKRRLDALLLHNYEDVLGMLSLTSLLSYSLLFPAKDIRMEEADVTDCIRVMYTLPVRVPVPVHDRNKLYELSVDGDEVCITIPYFRGTLKHYFSDWKNYFYLPEEDAAMHKSVASFVDAGHREKAKADTAYVKKTSGFLPQKDAVFAPEFKRKRKDKISWFEPAKDLASDAESVNRWLQSLTGFA